MTMKSFVYALYAVAIASILVSACPANAATAFLESCYPTTSVTGRLVYVGTYVYGGARVERVFPYMCPMSIEVY